MLFTIAMAVAAIASLVGAFALLKDYDVPV
jgi:hypothetical protein